MKNIFRYLAITLFAALIVACDENEIMPSFSTKGTATHTIAGITASTTSPAPSTDVTLTLSYVNSSTDPLKDITLRAKVGTADYVDVQRFDVVSEAKDQVLTKTIVYTTPASPATTIVFDMVITSQRQYPQVQRVTVKTK